MARRETDIETPLSPEGVLAVLTDFTDNRTETWPYLDPSKFEVYELGPTYAIVREGSAKPFDVWARERYDWSTPGLVTWKVLESDMFQAGTQLSARIAPRAGGGSTVHVVWERAGKSPRGKVIVALIALLGAKPIFSSYKKVFDAAAAEKA